MEKQKFTMFDAIVGGNVAAYSALSTTASIYQFMRHDLIRKVRTYVLLPRRNPVE